VEESRTTSKEAGMNVRSDIPFKLTEWNKRYTAWIEEFSTAQPCFHAKEYEMSIIQMLFDEERMTSKQIMYRGS
jgi:hypothetical protein